MVHAERSRYGRSVTPDESIILRLRHLLEAHKLAEQILNTVTGLLESKKAVAAHWSHRGCHLDCSAQFHKKQHQGAAMQEQLEQVKSMIRTKVEHQLQIIKRPLGRVKVR